TAAAMRAMSRANRERRRAAGRGGLSVIGSSGRRVGWAPARNDPGVATWSGDSAGRRPRGGPSPSGRYKICVRRAWTREAYGQCTIVQRAVQLPGVSFTASNRPVTRHRTRPTCRGRPPAITRDGMTSTQHSPASQALPQQRGPGVTPPTVPVALVPVDLTPVPQRPARRDVIAIKASLAAVRREPVALAESFYAHLFEMAPAARTMFASDMTAQMQRMTDVLLFTLSGLEHE